MVAPQTVTISSTAPTSINASDVTKYIKQNIKLNYHQEYRPEQVTTRSKNSYNSCREDEQWKKTMQRRVYQKECGFFAKLGVPYKECGGVELLSKSLVLRNLQNIGNNFTDKSDPINVKSYDDKKNPSKEVANQKQNSTTTIRSLCEKVDNNNGIEVIKEVLERVDERIVAVKAGQPLCAYMRKEKEKQKLQEIEKNNTSLDMLLIDPLEPGTMKGAITMEDEIEQSWHETVMSLPKMDFAKKLDCLILLITIIQNMKQRDLKTKVPLSFETVNILRKQPINEPLHPNHLSRKSMTNTCQVESYKGNHLLPPLYQDNISRMDVASSATLSRKRNLSQRQKQYPIISSNTPKVETWDELMSLDFNATRAASTPLELDVNHFRGVSRMCVAYGKCKRRVATCQTKTYTETLPPWQKILQDDRDPADMQNVRNITGNESISRRHDDILKNLKKGFEKTKKTHARKMKEELDGRTDACRKQFESFTLGHLREQDLKNMRIRVNEWRHKISLSIAPPLWYETLQQEQENYHLQDDDVINAKMQLLAKCNDLKSNSCSQNFLFISITNEICYFPFGNLIQKGLGTAKLCLLVLSLPIYEVCASHMQAAIRFFVCGILGLPEGYLRKWLRVRKLSKVDDIKVK